jgi:aspartyl-tRNA(Asn)/glutamyl-tRNA(Gln) amidotransferase subunit A
MSLQSSDNEICRMDAASLARCIKAKELSALEATEAVLRRMDALEPYVHAFCTPTPEHARAAAQSIDAKLAKGEAIGPLAGVPVGIKDLVATKGIKTIMGSFLYKDFVPDEDDIVVERLKAAGAVIIGKTNVPELGYSGVGHSPVFETTRNPWNLALTTGGSSAGSGASVATGVAPFAIGSDGGGSVRIPAAHCGLYGIKASMGRVPLYPGCRDDRYPGVSSWETLEHIGPMSRTVTDSALMLSVITGPDPRDRYSIPAADFDYVDAVKGDIKGLRVAYSEDWGYAAVDPEVRRIVSAAAAVFESELGCAVERANPGWSPDLGATFATLIAADTDLVGMRKLIRGREHEVSPHLVDLLMRPWTAEDFTEADRQRKAMCNKMWRFMASYDLLLTPTLAVPPFPVHMQGPEIIEGRMVRSADWLCFTFPANLTGQPAASVPAGFTTDGLPVGLQIIGRHLDDRTVLRASGAFERARPWAQRWPTLLDTLGL